MNTPRPLSRLVHDRGASFSLLRYVLIGSLVAVVDASSFQLLIVWHVLLSVATTISFVLAVTVHFNLNKHLNFRSYTRPTFNQAQTYAVVVFVCWLVTLAIVEGVTHLGFAPLTGKIAAIVVNVPVGFLGHRYFTFGPGIIAVVRRWLRSAPAAPEAGDAEALAGSDVTRSSPEGALSSSK